jgi:CheY-like chemotaxis protein
MDRTILRCFPRADRGFQREVEQLFAGFEVTTSRDQRTVERFELELRKHYPHSLVRRQDPLAALSPIESVWYVYRREEPAAGVGAGTGAPGVSDQGSDHEIAAAGGPGATPVYSANRVSAMVGVPVSVLVAWDEQDHLVRPSRTPGGFPLYSRDDVEHLLIAKRAFSAGRSVDEVRRLLDSSRAARATSSRASDRQPGRRLLVLLAERDPYAAEFSEYFLRTEGYEVEVAYNAAEAEARALELMPDLAVVELLISGGSGAELCARLKSRPGAIVLAISSLDYEDAALQAGADAFLTKPFEALSFLSTVKDLLGESAMLRELRPEGAA